MEIKKLFTFSGVAGVLFFILLLLTLEFLFINYNPVTQTISELGASDSPFHPIMNYIGFSILGISIMLFALGFREEFTKNFHTEVSFYCLFVGGFFMFLVGFFPCDAGCINLTPISRFHYFVSAFPALLIPIAAIISSTEISKEWGKKWGNTSRFLGLSSVISGPLMFFSPFSAYMGLIERIGVGIVAVWIFLISFGFYKKSIQKEKL